MRERNRERNMRHTVRVHHAHIQNIITKKNKKSITFFQPHTLHRAIIASPCRLSDGTVLENVRKSSLFDSVGDVAEYEICGTPSPDSLSKKIVVRWQLLHLVLPLFSLDN